MLFGRLRTIANLHELVTQRFKETSVTTDKLKLSRCFLFTGPTCTELPRRLRRTERKPWVTCVNELKRRARRERELKQTAREKILFPPENGLLVKELIPVAHQVYNARSELLTCVSKVAKSFAIYSCSVCGEVHVGHTPHKIKTCNFNGSLASKEHNWRIGDAEHVFPIVESFHLYDRIGRAVSHNEQLQVDIIPAIVELCVQAGFDILEFPIRRRTVPAYNIAGKIIDFERRFPKEDSSGEAINPFGFWEKREKSKRETKPLDTQPSDIQGTAAQGMEAWDRFRSGVSRLMQTYAVKTCGYCPEVQVGPKGHRVRNCQAYKHQMRDGQHAWQEATLDDLIPPVYVWHVRDLESRTPLTNDLKRYYGMLPAVVELFCQAGAQVSNDYAGVMRGDVAVPREDEMRLVV